MIVAVLVSRLTPWSNVVELGSLVGEADVIELHLVQTHRTCLLGDRQPIGPRLRVGRVEEVLPVGLIELVRRAVPDRHLRLRHSCGRIVEDHDPTDQVQILLFRPGGDGAQVVNPSDRLDLGRGRVGAVVPDEPASRP